MVANCITRDSSDGTGDALVETAAKGEARGDSGLMGDAEAMMPSGWWAQEKGAVGVVEGW